VTLDSGAAAALDKLQYSIGVMCVGRGGAENALTVGWISQVSFDPPMVAVAIDRVHYSEEFLRSTSNFVLNLLPETEKRLAAHFARESMVGQDKLKGVATRPANSGAAILEDALAYLDCEVAAIHQAGDHFLVIGKVEDAGVLRDGAVLSSASGLRYQKSKPNR
jgi:flavin reductase (DIM6/NTAB) family NADH-FMN oxidoreductase RutF